MLNVTIAASSKEAYTAFFDAGYNESAHGPGAYVRPNVGSLYKIGKITGLVLYLSPYEMIVQTIQVKGGRDIVAAYNFFQNAGGTKIVANLINVPSNRTGDDIIAAVEESLASFKKRFGGTKPANARSESAAPRRAARSPSKKTAAPVPAKKRPRVGAQKRV